MAGFDGGSQQRFVAEVHKQRNEKLVQNISNDSPEFFVTGLQSSVAYDIVLYAFNAKGRSQTIEFNETLDDVGNATNFILSGKISISICNELSDKKRTLSRF